MKTLPRMPRRVTTIVIDSRGDTAVTHKCGAMVVLMPRNYPGSVWCQRCREFA